MKVLSVGIILCLSVMMLGCGGQMVEVSQKYEESTNFKNYKTYNWAPGEGPASDTAGIDADRVKLLDSIVRSHIDEHMAIRGLTKVTEDPDLLVVYHIGIHTETFVNDFGMHYWEQTGWYQMESIPDGMMLLDFVDAKNEERVWRGTAVSAMNRDPNEEIMNKYMAKIAKKLLEQYPPPPSPYYN